MPESDSPIWGVYVCVCPSTMNCGQSGGADQLSATPTLYIYLPAVFFFFFFFHFDLNPSGAKPEFVMFLWCVCSSKVKELMAAICYSNH